ncbi:FAD-dependent oxidoreductase [Pseudonocardia sp.]|uniref:FAD-dependent oxidoreductase n=1 Tax=Pseudonocardia sp. TaxID=60912 RepID=UPI003D13AA91
MNHTTDVLVVGAGPAGLATAISALRHGARVLVVERRADTSSIPRATGMSTRTMEILRTWGLEAAVRAGAVDCDPMVAIGPTLTDPATRYAHHGFPSTAESLAVSPTHLTIVPQDHTEPVLAAEVTRLGGVVRFGTTATGLDVTPRGVRARLDGGAGGTDTVRARFVVGADGTRSTVRSALGIGVRDLGGSGAYAQALFRAPIHAHLDRRPPGIAFLDHPEATGVLLPVGSGRWEFAHPYEPERGEQPVDDPARWVHLVRTATGIPDLPVELLGSMTFAMTAAVATAFRAGPGFLVGDAAHRTTPAGATGLNTAIHDGHELGWKLAWVARGLAGQALLDSHEAERGPVGRWNAARSLRRDESDPADGLEGDLGRSYRSPVIDATDDAPPFRTDRAARPGERAPHVWLGPATSLLDVLADRLTLVTGPDATGWARAVARRERRALAWARTAAGLLPALVDAPLARLELLVADGDPDGKARGVAAAYRLAPGSAVLVRPDGIVAWRHDGPCTDHDGVLARALDVTLGWSAAAQAAAAG